MQIGSKVKYEGREWIIVGIDDSGPHPAAIHKHWELLLINYEMKEERRVLRSAVELI